MTVDCPIEGCTHQTAQSALAGPALVCWQHVLEIAEWMDRVRSAPPVVYFARPYSRRDVVKIGWTRNLPERMDRLRCIAVAVVDGDQVLEAELHRRFAHQRCAAPGGGRSDEWFTFDGLLAMHVDGLRAADPLMDGRIGAAGFLVEMAREERRFAERERLP